MNLGLRDKNAIITGASQGIGFAIAKALAEEGCNVAIGARGEERLEQAADQLSAFGVQAYGIHADFSQESGCEHFVNESVAKLGGIDVLVNNVGGMTPGRIDTLTAEQWRDVIDRNLMSYIWTTRNAIPYLKESSAGRILNISGISGKQLLPGSLTTTLPNAAINGFTKQMANELAADNITVNNLCPGIVNTDSWGPRADVMAKVQGITADEVRKGMAEHTMLRRWAEPEEMGNVAAFLVSEKNSYMTGTLIEVCGGWTRYF